MYPYGDDFDPTIYEGYMGDDFEYDEPLFWDETMQVGDIIVKNQLLHFWNGNEWELVMSPEGKEIPAESYFGKKILDISERYSNHSRDELLAALTVLEDECSELLTENEYLVDELYDYHDIGSSEGIIAALEEKEDLEETHEELQCLYEEMFDADDDLNRMRDKGWTMVAMTKDMLEQLQILADDGAVKVVEVEAGNIHILYEV